MRALVLWDIYAWAGAAFGDRDLELLARTWGTEGAATTMAQVAPSLVADRDFLRWFAKVQRHFVPPDVAAKLFRTAMETDARPLLPAIHVPTLPETVWSGGSEYTPPTDPSPRVPRDTAPTCPQRSLHLSSYRSCGGRAQGRDQLSDQLAVA